MTAIQKSALVPALILAMAGVAFGADPAPTAPSPAAPPPAAPEKAAPAPATTAKPAPPAPVRQLPSDVQSVLGREVQGPDHKTIGRIVDVVVDPAGKPRAAVIDFGGFLGVGDRRIAITWAALKFPPDKTNGPVMLEMTEDQLKAAPEYKQEGAQQRAVVTPPAKAGKSEPGEPAKQPSPAPAVQGDHEIPAQPKAAPAPAEEGQQARPQ